MDFSSIKIFDLLVLIVFSILSFLFLSYLFMVRNLKRSLRQLSQSFQELDNQAKLIVQTDLELNKTQESLDKRLSGLDALHKISRMISTTLVEEEIYKRLNQPLLTDLGFEKYLLLMYDDRQQLLPQVDFGFSTASAKQIGEAVTKNPALFPDIDKQPLLSSFKSPKDIKDVACALLDVKHFVITPILAQSKALGVLMTGNQSESFTVGEGDEEIISILADQVGHAIENARLFEEVYNSRQMLEVKVQQRTKELSSALDEVQKISKMKSEFISAVSHELRTPLTSIKGYASLLIAGKLGEIPVKVKERLEKINSHTDNLVQLINNLLDISRIESGHTEMKFLEHDIPSIVQNVVDLLTPQTKEKNINLLTQFPEGLPNIRMDTDQIERVFINLINNALKFTPENGTITVKAICDQRKITISVSDTGIGIKEENIPKLFTEFYRVENEINQTVKGAGLGLALVKKIILAHGGQIWVTSQQNHGTTFFFTFPLKQDEQP
jgi:signal transduction histidine kinase